MSPLTGGKMLCGFGEETTALGGGGARTEGGGEKMGGGGAGEYVGDDGDGE